MERINNAGRQGIMKGCKLSSGPAEGRESFCNICLEDITRDELTLTHRECSNTVHHACLVDLVTAAELAGSDNESAKCPSCKGCICPFVNQAHRWFDAAGITMLDLKDDCFDAGFELRPAMQGRMDVLLGGRLEARAGRLITAGEAKSVTLKNGSVVDETVAKPEKVQQLRRRFGVMLRRLRGNATGRPWKKSA